MLLLDFLRRALDLSLGSRFGSGLSSRFFVFGCVSTVAADATVGVSVLSVSGSLMVAAVGLRRRRGNGMGGATDFLLFWEVI